MGDKTGCGGMFLDLAMDIELVLSVHSALVHVQMITGQLMLGLMPRMKF